jgi:transposase
MYRWLTQLLDGVVVANPRQLRIISDTAYKSDRIDAGKLCDLLMIGMIPEVHVCSEQAWSRRMIFRQRVDLVGHRTRIKNRIHALIDQYPDAEPPRPEVSDLFGKLGRSWLEEVTLPSPYRELLDQLLEVLEHFDDQITRSDGQIRSFLKRDPRAGWLQSVPGIGPFFAAVILAEVDDIQRFPKAKNFVSYAGLVPGKDQSAERDPSRPIHKRGDRYLRWAFVEAAIPATQKNLAMKSMYDRPRSSTESSRRNDPTRRVERMDPSRRFRRSTWATRSRG